MVFKDHLNKMDCTILFNQTLEDLFLIYPIICEYQKRFVITLYSNNEIYPTLCHLFKNSITIKNEIIPSDIKGNVLNLGYGQNNNFSEMCKCFAKKYPSTFWEDYYTIAKMNYIKNENISKLLNRNYTRETEYYNKFIKIYGKNYIFASENLKVDSTLPVFTVNSNYYKNSNKYMYMWNRLLKSNNILDYLMIIENASEIHICNDIYMILCPYLNLLTIKKYIYTYVNAISYHNSYNDWTIIKLNEIQPTKKYTINMNKVFKKS